MSASRTPRTVRWVVGSLAVLVLMIAFVNYDSWRLGRVRAAILIGSPWWAATIAGEGAAFPTGERYRALCMAGDGPAAEFRRESRREYRILENGRVEQRESRRRRIRTSDVRFTDRTQWRAAVTELGARLRCESLTVVFPSSGILWADLDSEGNVVHTSMDSGLLP